MLMMALLLLSAGQSVFAARYFVYQLPDGTRVVTDRPQHKSTHKLVKTTRNVNGVGKVASKRYVKPPSGLNELDTLIEEVADRHSVDAALVKAVIHTESYFNPNAISRKGATGLMQLMPKTAKRYGVRNLQDPEQNLEAGVKHLSYLLEKYPSDLSHALAAYNAGERAVYKYDGIPPYRETQNYVKKVLHYRDYYRNVSNF